MSSECFLALMQSPSKPKAKPKPVKAKKKAPTKKKRRGWGPFQSVLKERSVDFNLTLDVQGLKQQVQDLTTLRDLLSTRTALRRHSPEGSLFHVVQTYFDVFRTGWTLHESGRKRLLQDQDQRAFLHSVMDPEIDIDNGLKGPDLMADQIVLYSTFIKFIRTTMVAHEIVVAEDSVIVKTQGRLRFQVLRKTIEMIFPHVIGDEVLVAQLVGQEVEPPIGITFHFNAAGKCCKYEFEVDFVEAFAGIVKDPEKLERLLGKALIADNCMFGIIDEAPETVATFLEDKGDELVDSHFLSDELLLQVVDNYYLVFEKGYPQPMNQKDQFISQTFVPGMQTSNYVQQRWRVLSECFDVLGFHQTNLLPVERSDQGDTCVVHSNAEYMLRIKLSTLETVFPHVLPHRELVEVLAGSLLRVSSQISFQVETTAGRIAHIAERMDFVDAMAALLPNSEDLSFVMAQALLSPDGAACQGETSIYTDLLESVWPKPKGGNSTRTIAMADILS